MSIRDEQVTNTTTLAEPASGIKITSPPEQEEQGEVGFPPATHMIESSSTGPANMYEGSDGYAGYWEECAPFRCIWDSLTEAEG